MEEVRGTILSEDDRLMSAIESLLFVRGRPVSSRELAETLEEPLPRIEAALESLKERLQDGIRIETSRGQTRLDIAPENEPLVARYLGTVKPAELSRSALEALTVVAYEQPVTRAEIDRRRQVQSDRSLKTLLVRGLVEEELGRESEPVYRTTGKFLEYFGISSLEQLPQRKNLLRRQPEEATRIGLREGE